MAFPNPFHSPMGPNLGGNFPPMNQMSSPQFDFHRDTYGTGGPGFDDNLRRYGLYQDADIRARLGFRDSFEPLPPGLDSNNDMAMRDRLMRERDLEMRDRHRDDRDRGRDRRRNDSDRDRGRGGDRDQDRDGNQSGRNHDRSGNRDRSPVNSGLGTGDPQYEAYVKELFQVDEDNDRSNSSSSDRYGSRDAYNQSDTNRSTGDGDKWVCNLPSRTIILRNLHQDIDEKIIGAELMMLGLPVKDIRLIRRSSGVSRGFAFVEFHNVADAQRWMEHTQGTLVLLNQYRASMAYSVTRDRANRDNLQRNDWVCIKCNGHNFKRRDFCYNCNLPRKESEKSRSYDGLEEIGTNPCNTLIFRGLDALTTEEALVTALSQAFARSSLAPIKNIVVIRDDIGTSLGFGFVEFHTVAASTQVLEYLNKLDPPLEVDGKQLLIDYAKNTYNTTMAYIYQKVQAQKYYDYSQYYGQGAATSALSTPAAIGANGENTTNTAAAVAQAAIQQAQAVKNFQKQLQKKLYSSTVQETVTVNGVEYPVYPPPDTSSYQYEETSGYYYDPLTHLYYDANSQYYYNATSGQYMYWDAEKSTYLPAPDATGAPKEEDSQNSQNKKDDKEEKKDKEKVKTAKKIAKDMEKWAKSMNAQKDVGKRISGQPGSAGGSKQESATADAGFAMLQKVKEDMSLMPPPPKPEKPAVSRPGLVASYGGDSDSGEEEEQTSPVDESKLVDWTKLACLLCKRQFQSKEILSKHTQVSELHKQNLEALIKSRGTSSVEKIEYRDRAKERRLKYGAPEPPEPQKRKDRDFELPIPEPHEEPTKQGIGGDNIGSKLLQKMGWSSGQGLGKSNQGRVDPIEAKRRNQMAGLGARGANVVADVGDDYRVALKKTMFARYNEVD